MGRLRAAEPERLRKRANLSTPSFQRHCASRVRKTMMTEKMTIIRLNSESISSPSSSSSSSSPRAMDKTAAMVSSLTTEAAFWTSSFDPKWIIFFTSFSSSFCGSFWASDCGTSTMCISCFSCLRRSEASGLVPMSAVILIPDMC